MQWRLRLRDLLLLIVCAIFAFGGSFTCTSSSDSDKITENPRTSSAK
jgi:hypothetical protein